MYEKFKVTRKKFMKKITKNNKLIIWKNILMKILCIIIFIVSSILILKIKIQVNIESRGMNAFLKLKVGPVEIKKNGRVVGKRKKRNNLNGEKKKKISANEIKQIMKSVELTYFDANLKVGLLFLFPTVFLIPILSTLLECLKMLPFKKIGHYKYVILPEYDRLIFDTNINIVLKIRVFDVLKLAVKHQNKLA